jgi:hypothetical protein
MAQIMMLFFRVERVVNEDAAALRQEIVLPDG